MDMDWPQHLDQIEHPSHPALQNLLATARDNVVDQLRTDGATVRDDGTVAYRDAVLGDAELTKFCYTFYYDWEAADDPQYMFLVQNPGELVSARHLDDEAAELVAAVTSDTPYRDQVRVNRGYLKDWLWRRNRRFAGNFFPRLDAHNLIDIDGVEPYLDDGFYNDFVLTDLVKYRVATKHIDADPGGNAEASFDAFLQPELDALDPDLVFCFGSRCWKVLYRNLDVTPVKAPETRLTDTVTNAHGYLFRTDDTYIIPLTHFSGRNSFLRDSYYDYLDDGLASFAEVAGTRDRISE